MIIRRFKKKRHSFAKTDRLVYQTHLDNNESSLPAEEREDTKRTGDRTQDYYHAGQPYH
jgi:hypothetical protein